MMFCKFWEMTWHPYYSIENNIKMQTGVEFTTRVSKTTVLILVYTNISQLQFSTGCPLAMSTLALLSASFRGVEKKPSPEGISYTDRSAGVDNTMSAGDNLLPTQLPPLVVGGLIMSTSAKNGYVGDLTAAQLHHYSCAALSLSVTNRMSEFMGMNYDYNNLPLKCKSRIASVGDCQGSFSTLNSRVHFVPEGGTVAQIVYSDDQDRPPQQVVYTADGTSYTSVDTSEHTLVYIHPVEATQAHPSQVAYVQQDATTQQVTVLLPAAAQSMNSTNLSVLGNVAESPQQMALEQGPQADRVSLEKGDRKDRDLQEDLWFELSSEALCNWMMFVRPAQNHLEQNLVAYQYGHHIYYTTIKNVEPKQELKVWYAASYAEFVNQKIHDISEEERKVLRDQEKNWPCYECNRRFMSSEQLQQHLNSHDEKLDFFSRARGRGRGRGKRRFGPGRRPGRPPKFMRLEVTSENGEKCEEGTQDLLDFSSKGQFDEVGQATLNGLEQQEQTPVPPETQSALGQQPEGHPLQLQQQHDESPVPTQSTMTADDMRRAKRIRNAALQHLFIRKSFRPFKCLQCGKAFREKDKLDQHLRFHGREGNCPLTCDICNKGFINSSALESHMKFHLDQKTYSCIFCPESFDRLDLLKDHVAIHVNDGYFTCPTCKKRFPDFIQVKKHVRSFHSEKIYQCTECDKAFCRPDKLRLHMLRHSDRKDFLCSTCGKQFKRKDKLREHMQRMHNPEREAKKADRISRSKTFKPRIASTDYESFMFKCRLCMMGFRRRGMLVNHLSKRHPDMKIEEVPELTLPIIKPNRDYFCQYCDKVYKSASKRKAHILKNHPGAELPPSIRKLRPAGPGEPDPMLSTHTQLTGTIATPPVCCPHCSKQYSSKTKMVQHIRKKHPEFAQLPNTIHTPLAAAVISSTPAVLTTDSTTGETVVTTDLLTQAMTELSQTLTTDYRTPQGDYQRIQYIPVSQSTAGLQQPQHIQLQVVQVAQATSPHQSQHSTVDVGQLHDPQTYTQHAIQVQHIQVTEPAPATQSSSQDSPLNPLEYCTWSRCSIRTLILFNSSQIFPFIAAYARNDAGNPLIPVPKDSCKCAITIDRCRSGLRLALSTKGLVRQYPNTKSNVSPAVQMRVGAQPLSPSSQQSQQELSPSQMQTTTSAPSQTLQQQQGSSVQHTYLPSTWNSFRSYPSEIQMMAIPQGQYVIAETSVGTPVTTVNTGQVKAVTQTHYVISEGQPDLDVKQNSSLSSGVQVGVSQPSAHCDPLESQPTNQQQTTQYIITTTTDGNGGSEVHITKPRTFSAEHE
ncbi:PR domain zinc finger protein 10 [Chelonia mydas]|uniref:PR domain zinc finger protein 10 n=1 Tax=Chelonia mydas TaxID=8469 RepID=M7AWV3_CHEMY|nr:PR domain zinc finger protein 10 [Chelonia mydas]